MNAMDIVKRITLKRAAEKNLVKTYPEFKSGDTIKVHVSIKEGEKERTQVFEGVVIKVQGSGIGRSFTVRKMSSGIGVERTFPFISPKVQKIELVSKGKVRRSRLFYLRNLRGRAARLQSELVLPGSEEATGVAPEAAAAKEASKSQPKSDSNKE